MSVYDLHFNKDDVTIRNILIGLLATMYDNIGWYNQLSSKFDDKRQIKVPFYFSTTGTERYLQDNFLNNIDYDPENLKAETFYNKIPRGIVDLSSINIESSNIVNKYVRMNYQREDSDGNLNTFNAEAFWVPIIMSLDVKIYLDSIVDQLKCTESIIKTFFKSKAYQVDVSYTRIPCLIQFPDDYTNERSIEFSFTDKKEFTVNFSVEVKSYIPIFKEDTEIFAGNTMEGFSTNIIIDEINSNTQTPQSPGSNSMYSNTPNPFPGATGPWPINPKSDFPPQP